MKVYVNYSIVVDKISNTPTIATICRVDIITFFLVLVKTESIFISPLIVFKSILTYGSLKSGKSSY